MHGITVLTAGGAPKIRISGRTLTQIVKRIFTKEIRQTSAILAGESEVVVAGLLPQGMVPNAGGNIVSFTTTETSIFYRVYSGNPNGGAFLTKIAPKSSIFAQEGLALPSSNTASFIQRVTVPRGVTLQRSRALGAFGKRGGLEQFQILNFDSKIIFHPGVPLR